MFKIKSFCKVLAIGSFFIYGFNSFAMQQPKWTKPQDEITILNLILADVKAGQFGLWHIYGNLIDRLIDSSYLTDIGMVQTEAAHQKALKERAAGKNVTIPQIRSYAQDLKTRIEKYDDEKNAYQKKKLIELIEGTPQIPGLIKRLEIKVITIPGTKLDITKIKAGLAQKKAEIPKASKPEPKKPSGPEHKIQKEQLKPKEPQIAVEAVTPLDKFYQAYSAYEEATASGQKVKEAATSLITIFNRLSFEQQNQAETFLEGQQLNIDKLAKDHGLKIIKVEKPSGPERKVEKELTPEKQELTQEIEFLQNILQQAKAAKEAPAQRKETIDTLSKLELGKLKYVPTLFVEEDENPIKLLHELITNFSNALISDNVQAITTHYNNLTREIEKLRARLAFRLEQIAKEKEAEKSLLEKVHFLKTPTGIFCGLELIHYMDIMYKHYNNPANQHIIDPPALEKELQSKPGKWLEACTPKGKELRPEEIQLNEEDIDRIITENKIIPTDFYAYINLTDFDNAYKAGFRGQKLIDRLKSLLEALNPKLLKELDRLKKLDTFFFIFAVNSGGHWFAVGVQKAFGQISYYIADDLYQAFKGRLGERHKEIIKVLNSIWNIPRIEFKKTAEFEPKMVAVEKKAKAESKELQEARKKIEQIVDNYIEHVHELGVSSFAATNKAKLNLTVWGAIEAALNYFNNKDDLKVFTAFASGGLALEYLILQGLKALGFNHIDTINIVDIEYTQGFFAKNSTQFIKATGLHTITSSQQKSTYQDAVASFRKQFMDAQVNVFKTIYAYSFACIDNPKLKANFLFMSNFELMLFPENLYIARVNAIKKKREDLKDENFNNVSLANTNKDALIVDNFGYFGLVAYTFPLPLDADIRYIQLVGQYATIDKTRGIRLTEDNVEIVNLRAKEAQDYIDSLETKNPNKALLQKYLHRYLAEFNEALEKQAGHKK